MSEHPSASHNEEAGAPVEWRFHVELRASPEELWPALVDTSRLNRAMGFGSMRYAEENGATVGTMRFFGGFESRWVEPPWSWVKEKGVSAVRIYDSGAATKVRVTMALEPLAGGGSGLNIHFEWWLTSFLFRPLFFLIRPFVRRSYERALALIDSQLAESRPRHALLAAPAPPLTREAGERLAKMRARLVEAGVRAHIIDAMCDHIERGDGLQLARLRVLPLARRWKIDERELIVAFLHATRAGLLRIGWDLICPHCRGVRQSAKVLGEVPPKAHCGPCSIEVEASGREAIEVSFSIDPSIREVERRVYCLAEPTSKEHIKIQQPLGPGERRSLETSLCPGRYRVRAAGERRYRLLDIAVGAGSSEAVVRPGDEGEAPLAAEPSPRVVIENTSEEARTFIIEDLAWVDDALRPATLFGLQEFRDLFADEQVAADIQIEVGEQAILFSDMVGSTRFYRRYGDAKAFAAVKRHFQEIYDVVRSTRGVVVKTIGDAAMAAFSDPSDALRAAVEIQRRFHPDRGGDGILLRISVNTGSCIAVNLNSGIDYFGKTVNLAAKLQKVVSTGQIAFPSELREDIRVQRFLEKEEGIVLEELSFDAPGSDAPISVCRWDVHRARPGSGDQGSPPSVGFF